MADADKIEIMDKVVDVRVSWEIAHDLEKQVNIGACILTPILLLHLCASILTSILLLQTLLKHVLQQRR